MERLEHPELFCDDKRLVVREHHATGANTDGRRDIGKMRDQHRRRRAGDARHVVVLRHPVPEVAETLDVPRQIERVTEGVADCRSGRDRCEIEDGKRSEVDEGHPPEYPSPNYFRPLGRYASLR